MVVEAFTLDGLDDLAQRPRRFRRELGARDGYADLGVLPRGSQCTDLERTESGKLRCADYRRPRGWERLYRRVPGRPGFAPRAQFRRVRTPEEVRAVIRAGYADLNNVGDFGRRAAEGPLEGTRTMAKKRKSAKVCVSKSTGKRVSCKRQRAGRKAARARKRSR